MLVAGLITVLLAAFLWAVHAQLERTLIESGRDRAQAAVDQLTSLMTQSLQQRTSDMSRLAADPALRGFLAQPTDESRRAAQARIRSLPPSGRQVVEVWNRAGSCLMTIATPAGIESTFPPPTTPTGDGLHFTQVDKNPVISDAVVSIESDGALDPENRLGYLVVRRPVSASPPEVLNKLVGSGARIQFGGTGSVWTDLKSVLAPPHVDLSSRGPKEFRSADGEARVGALGEIVRTPWLVWVDFPRSIFLAPAWTFLSRGVPIALAFVMLGGLLSYFAMARITTPLTALTEASESVTAGNLRHRVEVNRSDEIGRLATAFNSMVSQIQEAHEHLTLAVQGSDVGIWQWDAETDRVYLSVEWKQMLGYAENEIEGSRPLFKELVHPDDWDGLLTGIRACLQGDLERWESEHRLRHKDGSYCWVLARGVAYRDASGRPTRLAGTSIDITTQKAARDEAIAQARQAAFVADVAVALTEGHELRDMLQRCAQAVADHLGAPLVRVWTTSVTEPVLELQGSAGSAVHTDSAPASMPIGEFTAEQSGPGQWPLGDSGFGCLRFISDETVKQEGLTTYAEFPLVLGERLVGVISMFGRESLAESTLLALGSVARTVALGIERKQLEESRSRLEDLLESATDFVTIGQQSGPPLYINRAAREALGIGPIEQIPSLLAFRPPGFREQFDSAVLPSAIREGVWRGEAEYVARSGRVIPVSQVSIVHRSSTGHVQYISTISRDISDERRTAREHDELQEQLRRAQRIESIGQLAGGLAHDFNNLLTVILAYSNMLAEQFDESDPRRDDVDQIRRAGDRAAQLTSQLLAFSRKQILHPVVLDPNELIQGIGPMLDRVLGESIELQLRCDPKVNAIKFDPAQMELVLVNLAVNARDAMPNGGRLTIETANVDLDEEFCRTHLSVQAGHYVRLSISDTGSGMDEATKKRIFEPFFTTKARGKGTGLGLATVFGIVKQSGGSIWVYSEPGLGAAFKIYLPAHKDAKPLSPVRALRQIATGSETVLVVEDEAGVRVLVQAVLKRAGYTVLTASHPSEALTIAADVNRRFDLLLTDVIMPELNGAALYVRLREARPGIRVLFMSGFADEAIEHHGVLAAGTPFLHKPFTGSELAAKVRAVLDGDPPQPVEEVSGTTPGLRG